MMKKTAFFVLCLTYAASAWSYDAGFSGVTKAVEKIYSDDGLDIFEDDQDPLKLREELNFTDIEYQLFMERLFENQVASLEFLGTNRVEPPVPNAEVNNQAGRCCITLI